MPRPKEQGEPVVVEGKVVGYQLPLPDTEKPQRTHRQRRATAEPLPKKP